MSSDDTKRFDTPDESPLDTSETRQLGTLPIDDNGTKVLATVGALIPKRLRVVMPDKSEMVFDSLVPHLTVGRSSTVNTRHIDIDMEIYDKGVFGVSRFHAMIIPDDKHGLVVKDMQSTNGTYVNGKKLKANDNYPLANGDFVKFGNLKVQLFFDSGK
ncbi:MAG: FHA domain-containing protein [bacterium]|nr:FHA domain-containing protein [bacterium]